MSKTQSQLTVLLPSEIVDRIDDVSSDPMAFAYVAYQIRRQLPRKHRPSFFDRYLRRSRTLYHGYFTWTPIEFTYVQIGQSLVVVDAWAEMASGPDQRPDVIFTSEECPPHELVWDVSDARPVDLTAPIDF